MAHSTRRRAVLGILSCAIGGVLFGALAYHLTDPFSALPANSYRLFASYGCGASKKAIAWADSHSEHQIMVLSVDHWNTEFSRNKCSAILAKIQNRRTLALWLPEPWVCRRLTASARKWWKAQGDGSLPYWAVGVRPLGGGYASGLAATRLPVWKPLVPEDDPALDLAGS